MLEKCIEFLIHKHPWLTQKEAFALVMNGYDRYSSHNKYSGMAKTLMSIYMGILGRESRDQVMNRIAVIEEWI